MAIKHVSSKDFSTEVENQKGLALVDFWADWCGPCKMLSPIIEDVAQELSGKVTVAKVNIDQENDLAGRFEVMSIPTVVLFRDGKEVDRIVGFVPKQRFLDMVSKAN